MTTWDELGRELDNWQHQNRTVQLWWRDDDADRTGAAIKRMMQISRAHDVPVGIAVSPAIVSSSLGHFVSKQFRCAVMQHGYAHVNYAPIDQKKCELGDHRPIAAALHELSIGLRRMENLFGEYFLPVMVPPWNRISDAVLAQLNGIGFTGISGYTPRLHFSDHGLRRCNTHVDIINWRSKEMFVGLASATQLLITHLKLKRSGQADPDEPTGLLTHHLRHDDASWDFVDQLLAFTTGHPAVHWVSPATLFKSSS